MGELVKIDGGWLAGLIGANDQGITIPKPFEREILLLNTHIAGTGYVEGIDELAPHLALNEKLELDREPENPYDERAIVVRNANGVKLGYLPKAENEVISRLMDAGKLIFGRINDKEFDNDWWHIAIAVYLLD